MASNFGHRSRRSWIFSYGHRTSAFGPTLLKWFKMPIYQICKQKYFAIFTQNYFIKLQKNLFHFLFVNFFYHPCYLTWNGFWTPSTQRPFEGMKMRFAIWRPLVFKKISVNKRLVTSGTNEASNTPLCIQRRNIVFHNGYIATSTFGSKRAKITAFAISFTVFFMKSIVAKRWAALKADKTLWVPGSIQGGDTFV